MLNNIGWPAYWTFLAIALGIYYLLVYLFYYAANFKASANTLGQSAGRAHSHFENSRGSEITQPPVGEQSDEFSMPSAGSDESIVYQCMDEVKAFLDQAKKTKYSRPEMISSLKSILVKYPTLGTSPYKESVTRVIISEVEHVCSIQLSEGDLSEWQKG